MHGIFRTGLGVFALLSSTTHAVPKPNSIDIIVQTDENVPSSIPKALNQEISMAPDEIHTAEEFGVTLMVSVSLARTRHLNPLLLWVVSQRAMWSAK